MIWVVTLGFTLPCSAMDQKGLVSITPQSFSGSTQLTFSAKQRSSNVNGRLPWLIDYHAEFETLETRDHSIDIDRAWVRTGLEDLDYGEITWGRIHPWEVSLNPNASRPWGLAGSLQGQNRGQLITLDSGSSESRMAFPNTVFLGWIGAHYWNDPIAFQKFQWGFSFSPIFIPSLGSTFDFDRPIFSNHHRFTRFGPPVNTEYDDLNVAYLNRMDRDLLLQPQGMLQGYVDLSSTIDGLENWLWIENGPQADPNPGRIDRVENISGTNYVVADAVFPRRWTLGNTVSWDLRRFREANLSFTVLYRSTPQWTYEIGAKNRFVHFSFLSEISQNPIVSSGSYTHHLFQYEGKYPLGRFAPYWGAKHHLRDRDSWFRTGVRTELNANANLDVGADVFTGSARSYFGQWQANDRIYAVLTWDLRDW